jgi:dienelactone hydrolase
MRSARSTVDDRTRRKEIMMAEVLLFHHVQGLTDGMVAFADELRGAGHAVHAPDLFEGRTFASITEGAAYANGEDHPDFTALADEAAAAVSSSPVYVGFSFGVMEAQRLAQTRPGAAGAVLVDACVPISGEWAFGPWPPGVPVQVHGMAEDEFFATEGDLDAARELVDTVGAGAELFVYPGARHLWADSSLPAYDAQAAALLRERVLRLLAGC